MDYFSSPSSMIRTNPTSPRGCGGTNANAFHRRSPSGGGGGGGNSSSTSPRCGRESPSSNSSSRNEREVYLNREMEKFAAAVNRQQANSNPPILTPNLPPSTPYLFSGSGSASASSSSPSTSKRQPPSSSAYYHHHHHSGMSSPLANAMTTRSPAPLPTPAIGGFTVNMGGSSSRGTPSSLKQQHEASSTSFFTHLPASNTNPDRPVLPHSSYSIMSNASTAVPPTPLASSPKSKAMATGMMTSGIYEGPNPFERMAGGKQEEAGAGMSTDSTMDGKEVGGGGCGGNRVMEDGSQQYAASPASLSGGNVNVGAPVLNMPTDLTSVLPQRYFTLPVSPSALSGQSAPSFLSAIESPPSSPSATAAASGNPSMASIKTSPISQLNLSLPPPPVRTNGLNLPGVVGGAKTLRRPSSAGSGAGMKTSDRFAPLSVAELVELVLPGVARSELSEMAALDSISGPKTPRMSLPCNPFAEPNMDAGANTTNSTSMQAASALTLPTQPVPLILDLRPHTAWMSARLPGSINVCVPSTLLRRPAFGLERVEETLSDDGPDGDKAVFSRRRKEKWQSPNPDGTIPIRVIVLDSDSRNLLDLAAIHSLLSKFEREGFVREELRWLRGGWAEVIRQRNARPDGAVAKLVNDGPVGYPPLESSVPTRQSSCDPTNLALPPARAQAQAQAPTAAELASKSSSSLVSLAGSSSSSSSMSASALGMGGRDGGVARSRLSSFTSVDSGSAKGFPSSSSSLVGNEGKGKAPTMKLGLAGLQSWNLPSPWPGGAQPASSSPAMSQQQQPSRSSTCSVDSEMSASSSSLAPAPAPATAIQCRNLPFAAFTQSTTAANAFFGSGGGGAGAGGGGNFDYDALPTTRAGTGLGQVTHAWDQGAGQMGAGKKTMAANPFFDNIRQLAERLSLESSLANLGPIEVPSKYTGAAVVDRLPPFLQRFVGQSPMQRARSLAVEFFEIEEGEKKRLEGLMSWHSRTSGLAGSSGVAMTPGAVAPGKMSDEDRMLERFSIGAGVERGHLNRYKNMWPYDHARCKLELTTTCSTDYVNASHIRLRGYHKTYIASQGPLSSTYSDFWQLMYQERVPVVLMLTKRLEGGREKCGRYWKAGRYGDYQVDVVDEAGAEDVRAKEDEEDCGGGFFTTLNAPAQQQPSTEFSLTLRRTLSIRRLSDPPNVAPHVVRHIQYVSWPDFDVPPDSAEVLALTDEVNEAQEKSSNPNGPICVHCSAGVGRTGSYIMIDALRDVLRQGRREGASRSMELDPISSAAQSARDGSPMSISSSLPPSPGALESRGSAEMPSALSQQPQPMDSPRLNSPLPVFALPNADDSGTPPVRKVDDPIRQTVNEMRMSRMSMVANYAQYAFVYQTILLAVVQDLQNEGRL